MWLKFILDLLADESKHFALSACTGSLAYCLTWTISRVSLWAWERSTRRVTPMAAVYFTAGLCLLVGLACVLLSHAWLDGFSLFYVTPLGPHLQVVR